MIVIKLNHGQ